MNIIADSRRFGEKVRSNVCTFYVSMIGVHIIDDQVQYIRAKNGTGWGARSQKYIHPLFYFDDQKHYYYVRDDESFSFFDCYMGCSILLRRMGKCQER